MHTEAEAKNLWCPFASNRVVRAPDNIAVCAEGVGGRQVTTYCVGSACMAWRHIYANNAYGYEVKEGAGYCGLAGKP